MIIPSLNAGAKKYEILRDTAGYHSREAIPWLRDLALIKVYVSVDEPSCVMEMFSRTVKMLLEQSDNRFHAKVSRMKRKDSMCFWVSRYSYFLLEKFFEEEKHVIAGTLPFIAYGKKSRKILMNRKLLKKFFSWMNRSGD